MVSSINILPVGLMLQIFMYFRPFNVSPDVMRTIRDLASVTLRWRYIVTNTPEFWTFNSLSHKGAAPAITDSQGFDNFLRQVELHLSRSGNLALTVKWHTRDINEPQSIRLVRMLDRIGPFSRWKALEVDRISPIPKWLVTQGFTSLEEVTFTDWISRDVLDRIAETPQRLRRIRVTTIGTFDIPLHLFPMLSTLSVGRWCHSTRALPSTVSHLEMYHLHQHTAGTQLPDITHLTLTQVRFRRLDWYIFRNLQYFECAKVVTDAEIEMPSLRTLVMDRWREKGLILGLIRAPKLEKLDIGGTGGLRCRDHTCSSQDRELLDTSEHQLTPTDFNLGLCLWPKQILKIIGDLCSVQRLSVALTMRHGAQFWDELAKALIEGPGQFEEQHGPQTSDRKAHLICPLLTSLVLRLNWCQDDTAIWNAFALRIFKGRSKAGLLQYVRCEWNDGNMITVRG